MSDVVKAVLVYYAMGFGVVMLVILAVFVAAVVLGRKYPRLK